MESLQFQHAMLATKVDLPQIFRTTERVSLAVMFMTIVFLGYLWLGNVLFGGGNLSLYNVKVSCHPTYGENLPGKELTCVMYCNALL